MTELTYRDDIKQISVAYSHLGHRFLLGDVETARFLYGNAWRESPPLIKTISQLQLCLTAAEIEKDAAGVYCDEFLYYWGMIGIGEVSRLISKDIGAAMICFKKIIKNIPKAEARLAFIGLLVSEEPNKSENNVARLEVLRHWASKKDFFSWIVLSKIIFYQFLEEKQEDNFEPPIRVLRLLTSPCQMGHPVAIKFYNEMVDHMVSIGASNAYYKHIDESCIVTDSLYDL
jgi:hypothetical protein